MDAPSPKQQPRQRAKTDDAILPFPVRKRLWDQLWQRLLAPLPTEGDHHREANTRTEQTGEGR